MNQTHTSSKSRTVGPPRPVYQQALDHLRRGDVETALRLTANHGGDPKLTNLHGVCLLRLGKAEAAVSLYRGLVVEPGAGWARPGTPTIYKVNFALAQFLAGRFQGGAELLTEAQDERHPTVIRLRTCIRRWEAGLTFWQWINWKMGGSHPAGSQLPLDFEPGFLEGGEITEKDPASNLPEVFCVPAP